MEYLQDAEKNLIDAYDELVDLGLDVDADDVFALLAEVRRIIRNLTPTREN